MVPTTIEQFAAELGMPLHALLDQLRKAGVSGLGGGDMLSDADKAKLLDYLRRQHGAALDTKQAVTLVRTQTSEIVAEGSTGPRTIQVEVRRKFVIRARD